MYNTFCFEKQNNFFLEKQNDFFLKSKKKGKKGNVCFHFHFCFHFCFGFGFDFDFRYEINALGFRRMTGNKLIESCNYG